MKKLMRLKALFFRVGWLLILLFLLIWASFKFDFNAESDSVNFKRKEEIRNDSILKMSYEMEEIIDLIFSNQGYKLSEEIELIKMSDNQEVRFVDTNTLFVHVSPLGCWTCTRKINQFIISSVGDSINLIYLIPNKFSNEIQDFLDFVDIPRERAYFLSSSLGLPIEEINRIFLFTLDGDLIENVFPPTKYSQGILDAYVNSIIN